MKDSDFSHLELVWADDQYWESLAHYFEALYLKLINGEYDIPEIQKRLNFRGRDH